MNLGSTPQQLRPMLGQWKMTSVLRPIAIGIQLRDDIYTLWSIVTFNQKVQKPNVEKLCQTVLVSRAVFWTNKV